jgi:hypothetical protein
VTSSSSGKGLRRQQTSAAKLFGSCSWRVAAAGVAALSKMAQSHSKRAKQQSSALLY